MLNFLIIFPLSVNQEGQLPDYPSWFKSIPVLLYQHEFTGSRINLTTIARYLQVIKVNT